MIELSLITQKGHVISYESRKLKTHENNYTTYHLEMVAIIHALKMWRHHLISKRFLLMFDNISLKYLFDQQNLNARQARWLAFLSEYDFKIKHIKGKENKVADALSRNVVTSFVASISSYKIDLEDKLEEGIKLDLENQSLKEKVNQNVSKNIIIDYRFNEKGLMLYKNKIYVPNIPEVKLLILSEIHKSPYFGHMGYQKR